MGKTAWSEYEVEYLRSNYLSRKNKELASDLDLSLSTIRNGLRKLGLKKKRGFFRDNGDKHRCNSDYFENLNTTSSYILGFLLADGHISDSSRNRISIGLSKRDINVLEFIRSEICPSAPIRIYKDKDAILNISSKKIVSDLTSLGLRHLKSGGSSIIDNIRNELRPSFLRGFFDGNGSFSWRKRTRGKYSSVEGKFNLCGPDLKVLEKFKEYIGMGSIVDRKTHFYLQSSSLENIKRFYDIIYSDDSFFLSRKKEKFLSYFKEKENDENNSNFR